MIAMNRYMMIKTFFFLLWLNLSLSAYSQQWTLVWSDEFEYTGLPDSTKWSFDIKGNEVGWGNNEEQWYTDQRNENAYVSNGILRITAINESIRNKKYRSARLTTKDKGDWRYGRIEVSAKLPSGRGTWPAIWMLPTENSYGRWPLSGEIDIMEHVGSDPDSVFSTIHTLAYNHLKNTQVGKSIFLPAATDQFHIYSIEWDEHEIRSYVDGIQFFIFVNDQTGFESWPFDKPFHLLINLAIGGGLGGKKGIDDSSFPHYFDIDYVRIYQKINK